MYPSPLHRSHTNVEKLDCALIDNIDEIDADGVVVVFVTSVVFVAFVDVVVSFLFFGFPRTLLD